MKNQSNSLSIERTPNRDLFLEDAKRDQQAKDREDVRAGRCSTQSMHLFGWGMMKNVTVQFRDVDFG